MNAVSSIETISADGASLSVAVQKKFSAGGAPGFSLAAEFSVPSGITILFGPSGAGKTTLLECIAGLARPDNGRISAGDRVLFDSERKIDLPVSQRSIAYVFQTLALFPHLSVAQNVQYGLARLPAAEKRLRARQILESFRIEHLADRKPDAVSGGERQRAALARSLVTQPCLLLLDEPLAALDSATRSKIIADLRVWNATHRIPVLYVTHSREEVFALGERVIALEQGRILAQGTPQQVLEAPRHESIAQLAGFENIFDAVVTTLRPEQGTMRCRLQDTQEKGNVELEVPLARVTPGAKVRIAVRAGDILLATEFPRALSARNVLRGRLLTLARHGVTVIAGVDCGAQIEVHLTPGACDALHLQVGQELWLILKTYSCHLVAG